MRIDLSQPVARVLCRIWEKVEKCDRDALSIIERPVSYGVEKPGMEGSRRIWGGLLGEVQTRGDFAVDVITDVLLVGLMVLSDQRDRKADRATKEALEHGGS